MKILVGILGVIAVLAIFAILFTFPLMWAINYVFTSSVLLALFGTAQIGFWKTFVLSFATGVLFKGTSSSTSK